MPTLVSVEAYSGTLRRYEQFDRAEARLSHMYCHGGPATFTQEVVEFFRTSPDPAMRVEEDPEPPLPPLAALLRALEPVT